MILFDYEEEKQTSADAVSARVSISFSNFFANVSQKKNTERKNQNLSKPTHTQEGKKSKIIIAARTFV